MCTVAVCCCSLRAVTRGLRFRCPRCAAAHECEFFDDLRGPTSPTEHEINAHLGIEPNEIPRTAKPEKGQQTESVREYTY